MLNLFKVPLTTARNATRSQFSSWWHLLLILLRYLKMQESCMVEKIEEEIRTLKWDSCLPHESGVRTPQNLEVSTSRPWKQHSSTAVGSAKNAVFFPKRTSGIFLWVISMLPDSRELRKKDWSGIRSMITWSRSRKRCPSKSGFQKNDGNHSDGLASCRNSCQTDDFMKWIIWVWLLEGLWAELTEEVSKSPWLGQNFFQPRILQKYYPWAVLSSSRMSRTGV